MRGHKASDNAKHYPFPLLISLKKLTTSRPFKGKASPMNKKTDFLVIGSGLAGLSFALHIADRGQVTVCTKSELPETNTAMAQGGIAAVLGEDDSFEQHIQDTLTAGAGLCHPEVVKFVVEQGPARIRDLLDWGVRFDLQEGDSFALTKEGGHSTRRILHIADHTGQDIHQQLLAQAKAHPNIELCENLFAIELITNKDLTPLDFNPLRCLGAYVLDQKSGEVSPLLSSTTVLATGGAGKVYLYTSNWSGASGDGIALAYRAGARVANLEFMQFHPTCLYHPQARNFLVSEALRGEGAELISQSGTAFMTQHHPMGSLAPRDIVARSIDAEMKRTGAECVYLDISHKSEEFIKRRFPQIHKRCLALGIDMTKTPIPVVPAAHYLCGGVLTDTYGRTDIQGLFALGETACTGLHGANRLASNSLLECLVFSHHAAQYIKQQKDLPEIFAGDVPPWHLHNKQDSDELIVVSHMWDEIRRLMWNYVGIQRSNLRLERAQHRLNNIAKEIRDYYANFKTHYDIEELRNICLVADLTVRCALKRRESRGIHFNIDYPQSPPSSCGADMILSPIKTRD